MDAKLMALSWKKVQAALSYCPESISPLYYSTAWLVNFEEPVHRFKKLWTLLSKNLSYSAASR